eukprot:20669-Heterococcus_DN1.PRE.2
MLRTTHTNTTGFSVQAKQAAPLLIDRIDTRQAKDHSLLHLRVDSTSQQEYVVLQQIDLKLHHLVCATLTHTASQQQPVNVLQCQPIVLTTAVTDAATGNTTTGEAQNRLLLALLQHMHTLSYVYIKKPSQRHYPSDVAVIVLQRVCYLDASYCECQQPATAAELCASAPDHKSNQSVRTMPDTPHKAPSVHRYICCIVSEYELARSTAVSHLLAGNNLRRPSGVVVLAAALAITSKVVESATT